MYTVKTICIQIGLVVLMLLSMSGCNDGGPPPAQPEAIYGLLIKADGQVDVSRQRWDTGQWSPVSVGALIADDDLLEVAAGSATLLCPDLSVQQVSGGPDNSPCPRVSTPGTFTYQGYQVRGGVRGIDRNVPYILFPRQALILEERPLLRWHDTGAASYTVALEANGETIWTADDVTGTELRYPDTALEPGTTYQLVVQDTATGRSSLEDSTRGTGFRLADAEERAAIAQQWQQISALDALDAAEQQLAFAVYLMSNTPNDPPAFGYWGAAWLLLEDAAQVYDTPTVWRRQGEAFQAMRLPNEAEQAYQRALQQAETQGNREEQAAALEGLWRVTDAEGYRDQAITLYEELGDEQQISALQDTQ